MSKGLGVYKRNDGRFEARYRKGIDADGRVIYGSAYGRTPEEAIARREEILGHAVRSERPSGRSTHQLNLLILGAGMHGADVREIAEELGVFRKIAFLDDNVMGPHVLGRCKDAARFIDEYPCAFVAIGDNKVRRKLSQFLRNCGFILPRIISPAAKISKDADIGDGTVVFPQATIGACTIGEFDIIASNSLINSGATIGDCVHIDCGSIVMNGTTVPEGIKLKSGEIYR